MISAVQPRTPGEPMPRQERRGVADARMVVVMVNAQVVAMWSDIQASVWCEGRDAARRYFTSRFLLSYGHLRSPVCPPLLKL